MKPLLTLTCLLTASVASGQEVLEKPVTIKERPHRVGDRHRIRAETETTMHWRHKAAGSSQSTRRGGTRGYVMTVTAVDAKQRVQKLSLKLVEPPPLDGEPGTQTIVRGRTKTPGYWLAKKLLQRKSVVTLFGMTGTFKPKQRVKLRKTMWDELVLNGTISEQDVRYLGVEKKTGLALLKVRYLVTETDVSFKGCTVRSLWKGTIAFDPKGPRLRRATLDADVEVFLPPGKPGKATGWGRIRWSYGLSRVVWPKPKGTPAPKATPKAPAKKRTRTF